MCKRKCLFVLCLMGIFSQVAFGMDIKNEDFKQTMFMDLLGDKCEEDGSLKGKHEVFLSCDTIFGSADLKVKGELSIDGNKKAISFEDGRIILCEGAKNNLKDVTIRSADNSWIFLGRDSNLYILGEVILDN